MGKLKIKQVNVTDVTPSQQRELFKECMNWHGFAENQNNQPTTYK